MSSDPDAKKSNYPVGYKKPPRHSRFKPGRSGNPRGRPKRDIVKQDAQSLFAKVANAKVTVKLHGKVIRISKEEFLMRRIFQEAEKGNAAALNYFYKQTHNEITLEYILFKDFNDSLQDAAELVKLYRQIPADLVNIIEYNPIDLASFSKPDEAVTENFMQHLEKNRVNARLRKSRGKDIDAACGQLANKDPH